MSVVAAIRRMVAAGLTIEQALLAAEAFETETAPGEPLLTKRQGRNKRYYERLKASENSLKASEQDVSDGDHLSSPEGSSPKPLSPNPHQSIPPSPPKGGSSPVEIGQIVAAYGEMAARCGLAIPRTIDERRKRAIGARLRESGLPAVLEAIGKIERSRFCLGENDRGWRADIDFLLQPKSFTALLEGKYDGKGSQQPAKPGIPSVLQRYDWIILADGRVKSRALNDDEWLLHDGVTAEQIEAFAMRDLRPGRQAEVSH